MNTVTKAFSLFFLLALAVYSGPALGGDSDKPATSDKDATGVKVLPEDGADPLFTPPDAAKTKVPEGTSVSSTDVKVSDAGTVEIHVNDANLVEVLRMLSLQSQKNIVASKDVHGSVTANLYDVTVREALD